MKAFRAFCTLSAAALAASVAAAPAHAATASIQWEMNEAAGATVMHDSGSQGINGSIGSEVTTGVVVNGATGFQFPRLTPNQPPTHPQHLVVVPDQTALDPESGTYTVEIRYRTTNAFGNLI